MSKGLHIRPMFDMEHLEERCAMNFPANFLPPAAAESVSENGKNDTIDAQMNDLLFQGAFLTSLLFSPPSHEENDSPPRS